MEMDIQTNPTVTVLDVQVEPKQLLGTLAVPSGAKGMVVFGHASGSRRFSARSR